MNELEFYEQLRAAGFPLEKCDSILECTCGMRHVLPKLEEVIDAIGNEFEGIRKVVIEFDHTHYWLAETDDTQGVACKGLTPLLAVVNLFLALNKER